MQLLAGVTLVEQLGLTHFSELASFRNGLEDL